MKRFEKFFRHRVSYEKIDKYVNLVLKTLDPDDDINIMIHQFVIEVLED